METQKKYNITEDSIVESYVPVGEFRKYFKKTIGDDMLRTSLIFKIG